ncbi:MAG: hypothetical protein LGR52_07055 [Candidatus Thiosymbion ectosymbiont of Robbea hypermnestra]|nr:hypothetical protein [Candidatus Thiosymbion ectosymbiont of Robbea hypermnestra]
MNIEIVKMMRNIRDQMSLDIKGMTFEEEQDYLRSRIKTFEHLIGIKPDKESRPTARSRTRSARAVLGG